MPRPFLVQYRIIEQSVTKENNEPITELSQHRTFCVAMRPASCSSLRGLYGVFPFYLRVWAIRKAYTIKLNSLHEPTV